MKVRWRLLKPPTGNPATATRDRHTSRPLPPNPTVLETRSSRPRWWGWPGPLTSSTPADTLRRCRMLIMVLGTSTLFAANKEERALATQVQLLQDRLSNIERSINEHLGVMADLINRNKQATDKWGATLQQLEQQVQQQKRID